MEGGKPRQTKRPFDAVESTWTPASAPYWAFRTYLSQTLGGFLKAFVEAGEEANLHLGIVHIPARLADTVDWWPLPEHGNGHHLLRFDATKNDGWRELDLSFRPQSGLGQELWALWAGDRGCGLLVAHRPPTSRRMGMLPLDAWRVLLTWMPTEFEDALRALAPLWRTHPEVSKLYDDFHTAMGTMLQERRETPNPLLRSALTLADHMDPWTRRQITESTWITLLNRIQERVAWELRIERLMPAIGEIVHDTLGYDFFELLVFTRPGKRHEEFLSWRRNLTGYGGKAMNLLLDSGLVSRMVRDRKPRLINTIGEHTGVMNPHLAELARLREGLIIPLSFEKRVHGIMSLYYRHPTGLQQRELERIVQVGQVIARSIENSNAHENMRRMATIDPLTGLYNRRSFSDLISKEMRRSQRYKQHFSLIMLDIDHFKRYNDSNGHLQGDQLLKKFSAILRSSVREQDIVARYGGEEFAIILPHTALDAGYVVAEKIRKRVLETEFPNANTTPEGRVSFSAGIADTSRGAITHQELIDQADQALYEAKGKGRNCSVKYRANVASHTKN